MILGFLKLYQLDIMLVLSGVCLITTLFAFISRTLSNARKRALLLMLTSSVVLLMSDRLAYLYRGDPSFLGFWTVRISNFLVFFLTLAILYGFNMYLINVHVEDVGYTDPPKRLIVAKVMLIVGMILIIISQFTGLYYTFDITNTYQRAPAFILCYAIPITVILIQLSLIIHNRSLFRRSMLDSLLAFTILPLVASIAQVFAYGVSLTNITLPLTCILLYIFALNDLNEQAERARILEIEYLKAEEREARMMFEQTATALANAIDAKDAYTRGHSTRVAQYARTIARIAGKTEEFCEEVYYAGLLHDVGKIGIPDSIINKEGKLTDEEFAVIKTHPAQGDRILEGITQSPYLHIGARHHHERYDGHGYPDGLADEEIPEIARIIAVADAYDAMTSKRSYRATMAQGAVREQIERGLGTQFDPTYGSIMLQMIDDDPEYLLRERDD